MLGKYLAAATVTLVAFSIPYLSKNYLPNEIPNMEAAKADSALASFDYVVTGKVQGVYFRKFTKEQADQLGLKGWVMNTKAGTVVGTAQGPQEKLHQMEVWLSTKGSPSSKITKFEKKNVQKIAAYQFPDFAIRK